MNLTFYENSKENRSKSFTPKLDKLTLPSIFTKFETEKNFNRDSLCLKLEKNKIFLPNYTNIKEEMDKVKKQFRNLFDIKNTIFKDMITKSNSSTYQNFVRGFGKYFFGPFGIVTQKYNYLKEYYIRTSALNVKIYAGKLDYYDYINKYNRFKQRQNNANKKLLSISKNYAIVNDRNDIFSMKALTSKRYIKRKNYVSLNKQKYKSSMTEINEIQTKNNKKANLNKNNYKNKNNNKSILKLKLKSPGYLKAYNNFYNNKSKNIFDNYKKAVSKIQSKYNKKTFRTSNTEKTRANTQTNEKTNSENNSILFLTQGIQGIFSSKSKDKKVTFNNINNLTQNKIALNKSYLKNISLKV